MNFHNYDDLTMEQRVNAIQDARLQGVEAAKRDWNQTDGKDQRPASPLSFLLHVIDPAFDADLMTNEEHLMWKRELEALDKSDPRTAAFIAAYNEQQNEMIEAL